MQDKNGSDSGYQVPGTGYLAPLPHSRISNLNKAVASICCYAEIPGGPCICGDCYDCVLVMGCGVDY